MAGVALLTLTPSAGGAPTPVFCFPCGHLGSADAVLNTVLFLPLGVLGGILGLGAGVVAALGFGGSAFIEAVQFVLPGRYPTLADVVVNGLGAVVGWFLWRRLSRGLPPVRVWAAAGAGVLLLTAWASWPAPPPGVLYGQYTPRLGSFAAYDGEVVEVRLGDGSVASGPLADSDEVRARLAEKDELSVTFRLGTPPRGWAPVFAIFSADREEAVFVGVRGDDVLARFRSRGGSLRFAEPSMVLYDGLQGLSPGDTATVRVTAEREGFCVETAGGRACGLGPGPLEGWRYLRRDLRVPLPWTVASALGVALLAAVILVAGPPRTAWGALAGLGLGAGVLPAVTPLAALSLPALALGLVAGVAAARWARRRGVPRS